MIKWIFEKIIIELFIYYEKITKDIFFNIAINDVNLNYDKTQYYWEKFDTSSAVNIKGLIKFLKKYYNINWYEYKKNLKEKETYARQIRGDIIHAKKKYTLKEYTEVIKIIFKLIRRKKKELYKSIKNKSAHIREEEFLNDLRIN